MAEPHYRPVIGWEQLPPEMEHRDVVDIAISSTDEVHVLTRTESRVIVYGLDGNYIRAWGEDLVSARPHSITIDANDLAYIVDEEQHCVLITTTDGELKGALRGSESPSPTGVDWSIEDWVERQRSIRIAAAPFNRPTKVAVSGEDLYVSDGYGNARVHRFTRDGEHVSSWGEPGSLPGEFRCPHSVCVDTHGRVLVADRENDRIQVFGRQGNFVEEWTDVQRPTAIALGMGDQLYVAELSWASGDFSWRLGRIEQDRPARITIRSGDGEILEVIGRSPAWAFDGFFAPHGLALDRRGDLYVGEVTHSFGFMRGIDTSALPTFRKLSRRAHPAS